MCLAVVVVTSFAAFPITSLTATRAQVANITNGTKVVADATGNALVGTALRTWATLAENMVLLNASNIDLKGTVPDQTIDGSCSHTIQALNNHFDGTILHDSYLNGSISIRRHQPPAIFAEAYLDNKLAISTDARVRTGVKLFGHCSQIARDTVGIAVHSTGQTIIASELSAQNMKIELVNHSLALTFNLNFTLQAELLKWNMSQVTASKGCKIKILGITIISICGWIEDEVKKNVQPLIDKVTTIYVPALIASLEAKVDAKIGDKIVIPLKI